MHDLQLLLAVITSTCECCSLHTTDRIKFDHTAFLCELLDEVGRKDLTEEVKKYLDKTESELVSSHEINSHKINQLISWELILWA